MELQAKDLRIGNLIYWNIPEKQNVPHEVVGIVKGKPQTIPISLGESIEDYEPIPLTEEWIVKLGFKKTYDEFVYDKGEFRIEFIIWADDNPEWKIKRFDGVTFSRHSEIKTKYVHQLQNLYHALTGKELEIKGDNNVQK